jgi:hypothetical protein
MGYGQKDPQTIQINVDTSSINTGLSTKANQSDLDITNQNVSANTASLAEIPSLSILKYSQYKVGNDWSNAIVQGVTDAISQKKRLVFEPYVIYQTSLISLTGRSGLIVDFNGATLKALDNTEGKCIEIGTCSNITINNLNIDGNNTYYRGISLLDGNTDINLNNIFIKNISPIIQATPTNINSVALWISLSNNNRIFVNNIKVDTVNNNNNTTVGDSIGSSRGILFDYVNIANGTNCTNVRINGVDIKNILSEDGDGIAIAGNNAEVDIKIKDISLDNCFKRGLKIQGVFGAEIDGIRIRQSNRAAYMWSGMSLFCSGNFIKNVDMDIYAVKGIEYTPNYNDSNKSRFQHVKITLTNDTSLGGNFVFPIDLLSVSGNMTVSNVNIEDVTTLGPAESIKVRTFSRNLRIKRANLSSYAGNLISINMEYNPGANTASDGSGVSHKNMILEDIITDTISFYTSTSTTYENCIVDNFISKDGKDPYTYIYPFNNKGMQILTQDTISVLKYGVKLNTTDDQAPNLQAAINDCIANNKALYLPAGTIHIKSTIIINGAIEIFGHNESTYSSLSSKIVYDNQGTDVNIIKIEKSDGSTCPSVRLRRIYIARQRNSTDDGYDSVTNPWVPGMLCTGIYAHCDESIFDQIAVVGCKIGIQYTSSQIDRLFMSDILFNTIGVKFYNNVSAMNIEDNNMAYNTTTFLSDCIGYSWNFKGNHAETAINHFIFNIGTSAATGNNNNVENVHITSSNFTQNSTGTEGFIKVITNGSSYCYLRNVIVDTIRDYMQNNGNPHYSVTNNTQAEVNIFFKDCVFWTNSPISGGDIKGSIWWHSPYFNNVGSKWADTTYITSNVVGFNTSFNDAVKAYLPIDFKKYDFTVYPANVEGRLFYDSSRNTFDFYNSKSQRMNLPMWYHYIVSGDVAPSTTGLIGGTIAQNLNAVAGSPLGWVWDNANSKWLPFGQVGYRSNAGSPSGVLTPKFVGESVLDTTNNKWWKATGTANTNWA